MKQNLNNKSIELFYASLLFMYLSLAAGTASATQCSLSMDEHTATINYDSQYNIRVNLVGTPVAGQQIKYSVYDSVSKQYMFQDQVADTTGGYFTINFSTNPIFGQDVKHNYYIGISGLVYKNGKYKMRTGFYISDDSNMYNCALDTQGDFYDNYIKTVVDGAIAVNVSYYSKFMQLSYSTPTISRNGNNYECNASTISKITSYSCSGTQNQNVTLTHSMTVTIPWAVAPGSSYPFVAPPDPKTGFQPSVIKWPVDNGSMFDFKKFFNAY